MAIKVHHEGASAKAIGGHAPHLVLVIDSLDALTAGIADSAPTASAAMDQNTGPERQLLGSKPSNDFGFDLHIVHDAPLRGEGYVAGCLSHTRHRTGSDTQASV